MKVVGLLLVLVACFTWEPAWGSGAPISIGLGGGLDASTYASEGLFDIGPVVSGYAAWTGSYPRVYRLSVQLTRLRHDGTGSCSHGDGVASSSCQSETLNLTAIQLGVLWFEADHGRGQPYGGISSGAHAMRQGDDPLEWSPMVSVILGTRLMAGGLRVSIEGGGELVIGGDTGFAVIPMRMFIEF